MGERGGGRQGERVRGGLVTTCPRPLGGAPRPLGGKSGAGGAPACSALVMDLTRTDWSSTPFSLSSEPMSSLAVARRSRTARLVVGGALATGAVTQALFWRVGIGLNFFLWTLLAVAASLASVRPRRVTRFAWGLIVAACLLGFSVLRFAGDWTLAIAVPTDLALLALLPLVLRDPVQMRDAARLPLLAARTLRRAPRAAREATRLPTVALGGHGAVWLQVVRGTLVGLPVTGIFVLLLSADIDFRMLLGRMEAKLGDALSFGAWTVATAAASLLTHVLLQLPEPDASLPGAASQMAYRCATTDAAVSLSRRRSAWSSRPGSWSSGRSPSSSRSSWP